MGTRAETMIVPLGAGMRHTSRVSVTCHLSWNSVGLVDLVTTVVSLCRNSGNLGQDDGPLDGSCYLLGALNKTSMTIVVPKT